MGADATEVTALAATARRRHIKEMADRYASFFGPILPQAEDAPPAFTDDQLVFIQARRIEADIERAQPAAWTRQRRFATILPAPRRRTLFWNEEATLTPT